MTTATKFFTTESKGYLGATRLTGSQYAQKKLYGTDLSKAISKSLRDNVKVSKKSHISVRNESSSLCQHVYVTIKLERDRFAKPYCDALAAMGNAKIGSCGRIFQMDDAGNCLNEIDYEYYCKMPEAARRTVKAYYLNAVIDRVLSDSPYTEDHQIPSWLLTDEATQIIEDTKQILSSYNYDDSNGQVDYFDTHFYETVYIRWI